VLETETQTQSIIAPEGKEGRKLPILIVDDEFDQRERLRRICTKLVGIDSGYIHEASTVSEAEALCEAHDFHVILLDKMVGSENGIAAIPDLLNIRPNAKILVVTGSEEIDDVVRAMKMGAEGFVAKRHPREFVSEQIEKALSSARYKRNEERLKSGEDVFLNESIETKSPVMKRVLEAARMVAESNRPLLLLGESGVGKTTIARFVHRYRSQLLKNTIREFVEVNLTSFPSTLVESELFGHERGSFTGALDQKIGHLEKAHNGTLFFDEIGDISGEIQSKILKVVEEKKFYRVGGRREIHSNFKLICATNRDLEKMVEEKKFRDDLYYRISVFPLHIPALRERREDIPGLLKKILPSVCREEKRFVQFEDLPTDFVDALVNNPPKQNIRGLEIALSQLLTLSKPDRSGRLMLDRWTSITELRAMLGVGRVKGTIPATAITLDELMKRPFALIDNNFPGLTPVLDTIENKLVLEASGKADKAKEIPEILKVSRTCVHGKMKKAKEWLATQSSGAKIHSSDDTNKTGMSQKGVGA